MTILLLCIAGFLGSAVLGRWLALREVPALLERKWNDHVSSYPTLSTGQYKVQYTEQHRREAVGFVWSMMFFWYVMLPISTLTRWNKDAVDEHDPFLQQEKIIRQAKRIAELERELGI